MKIGLAPDAFRPSTHAQHREISMSVEVIVYAVAAVFSAVAAFFAFRRSSRYRAQRDAKNAYDQGSAGFALAILAMVLVVFATH